LVANLLNDAIDTNHFLGEIGGRGVMGLGGRHQKGHKYGNDARVHGNVSSDGAFSFSNQSTARSESAFVLPIRYPFRAALAYIDAECTEIEEGLPILADTVFVKTPQWSATLSGQLTVPLASGAEFIGRIDYAYKSKIHHDQLNSPVGPQDAYGLLNGRLSYTSVNNKWSLSLFGSNLTDERSIMAATDLSDTLAFGEVQWARLREWGVSFRYNF